MTQAMLQVKDLHAYYGKSHVLRGVDMEIMPGEVIALLGRNGVGRSTTAKAIMGEVTPRGEVLFKGEPIAGLESHKIARMGLGYVPESRDIFPSMTVRQNLVLGVKDMRNPGKYTIDEMLDMFPNLRARADNPAGVLSGGEKQMLTMCRTLMGDPELIIIDEPTEGLAPVIVQQIGRTIQALKDEGFTIILVEQNFRFAASVADRHYVVEQGRVVDMIPNADLDANIDKLHAYLGV